MFALQKFQKITNFHKFYRLLTTSSNQTKVGIIGLGNVGQLVAANVQKSPDYQLFGVMDKNSVVLEKYPTNVIRFKSPAELAEASDITLTTLPMPPDVKSVMEGNEGVLAGIKKDSIWIDHSTTDYEQTIRLAGEVETREASALESPVTGGIALLKQGQMTTLVGGKKEVFDKCEPLLKLSCANVLYMGEMGTATITKVVSNMLAGAHVVLMGEAMMIAKRSGLDLKSFFHGIRLSSGNSFVWESEGPLVFNDTYDPDFHIKLHCKDFKLGHEISMKNNVPIPVFALLEQIYHQARVRYGDEAGSTHPAKFMSESIGESLHCDSFDDWTYGIEMVKGGSIGIVHKKKDK